jgi:hypothetical protein
VSDTNAKSAKAPPLGSPRFRIMVRAADADDERQMGGLFDDFEHAEAAAQFLQQGKQFGSVRVEALTTEQTQRPPDKRSRENQTDVTALAGFSHDEAVHAPGEGVSEEPLFGGPRRAASYNLLIVSTLLVACLLALVISVIFGIWLVGLLFQNERLSNDRLGLLLGAGLAAGLILVLARLHAYTFQEGPDAGAGPRVRGRLLTLPPRWLGRRLLAALAFALLVAAMAGLLVWVFWPSKR